MTQTVLYIACSLDGKIARSDDSLDWLFAVEGDGDNGYATFMQDVGAVIMGRKTFDEVLVLSDDYPYSAIDNYVLTRQTGKQSEHAMFTNEPLDVLLDRIGPTIDGKIWLVGGGELIQEALRLKRVDQLELAIAPVVLGSGIPLFPEGTLETRFRLTGCRPSGQFIMATYDVLKG
ncbi:dihydrofolate reductase [Exiguobacterium sp. PvP048]|uniref:dihydrofolate reductase family protein n=1 Tax=Exiguobacterium TaxID=33986 RepID=UPI001BE8069E|nr:MULTISPECIES: dihydrofolate reductase family protein [Exiguobacterium]MCT4791503.1 dihydrofolate reductase family protein [Exiguobacterium artemiae]